MILNRPGTIYQAAVSIRSRAPSGTRISSITTAPGQRGAVIAHCRFSDGTIVTADFVPPGKRIAASPDLAEAREQFVGILGFLGRCE